MPRRLVALCLVSALCSAAAPTAQPLAEASPEASLADVETISAALRADQRAHLWRVGAWGLANAVGGTVLVLATSRDGQPFAWSFGVQSGAWGAVNVGIAAVGLVTGPGEVTADWATALAAENGYADVLLLNLGLNVGYAAVGGTLLAVAGRGVARPDEWRGHGAALVLQGAGLFVLDAVAYFGTRARLGALVELASRTDVVAAGAGVGFVVTL